MITHSVISNVTAAAAAFSNAERTTLVGSIIPASNASTTVSLAISGTCFLSTSLKIISHLVGFSPAFLRICWNGASHALNTICPPLPKSVLPLPLIAFLALNNATPAPCKIPSSIAAFVACKASSKRSFFSFISISVPPPTLIIATPPTNLPKRSCNFSTLYGVVSLSNCALSDNTLSSILSASPLPSTIVVVSLPTVTILALPNQSIFNLANVIPLFVDTTVAPVKIAISSNIWSLKSPNPGALTAATFNAPLPLFITNVANASPSISSATISKAL